MTFAVGTVLTWLHASFRKPGRMISYWLCWLALLCLTLLNYFHLWINSHLVRLREKKLQRQFYEGNSHNGVTHCWVLIVWTTVAQRNTLHIQCRSLMTAKKYTEYQQTYPLRKYNTPGYNYYLFFLYLHFILVLSKPPKGRTLRRMVMVFQVWTIRNMLSTYMKIIIFHNAIQEFYNLFVCVLFTYTICRSGILFNARPKKINSIVHLERRVKAEVFSILLFCRSCGERRWSLEEWGKLTHRFICSMKEKPPVAFHPDLSDTLPH